MTKPTDDLEAVRQIAATLEEFGDTERERIIRWARERLGMAAPNPTRPTTQGIQPASQEALQQADIKTFVQSKNPRNDIHLAATVAYFHKFVAPEADRKDAIGQDDLITACRLADRRRPARPAQTLINAFKAGVIDKVSAGKYRLNSVGENLVAMVLAEGVAPAKLRRGKGRKKNTGKKKTSRRNRLG